MSKETSSEQQHHDLQQEIATKKPTVEELLKMLSSSSSKRPSPPPIPPKPKHGFEMSIEAAKRSLGLLPDAKKFPKETSDTKRQISNKSLSTNKTFLVTSKGDEVDHSTSPDYLECSSTKLTHDPSNSSYSPTSRLEFYENNQPPPATSITRISVPPKAAKLSHYSGVNVVYNSSVPYQHSSSSPPPPSAAISNGKQYRASSHQQASHHKISSSSPSSSSSLSSSFRPTVTEMSNVANNNLTRQPFGSSNTSTVEILEVRPNGGAHSTRDIHGNISKPGHKAQQATVSQVVERQQQQQQQRQQQQQQPYSVSSHRDGGVVGRSGSAFASSNLVVVTTTDSDDYDERGDNYDGASSGVDGDEDAQLAKEVETIMSDSLLAASQPRPMTSTPTPTSNFIKQRSNQHSANSSSGASTATNNNNRSGHQDAYIRASNDVNNYITKPATESHDESKPILSDSNSEGVDILDISRETDELTNTSVHNQSGCELVGVNDNSDPQKQESPSSKICGISEGEQQQAQGGGRGYQEPATPYTVQFFNDTLHSPSGSLSSQQDNNTTNSQRSSTEAINNNNNNSKGASRVKSKMSIHEIESNSLRNLVSTLQNQIEKLNNKVSGLTSKVEVLESELDRQKRDSSLSKSTASIFTNDQDNSNGQHRNFLHSSANNYTSSYQSPMSTMQKLSPLSQSVLTINKLTPMRAGQQNNSSGLMSTYSRSGTSQQQENIGSSYNASHLLSSNAKRLPQQQPQQYSSSYVSGSVSRQNMRKSKIHTSTNSLYAESNKSGGGGGGSASISPTPTGDSSTLNRQYASPSSYLNLTQQKRADPNSYNSMLSLSSLGNSTLKQTSIAGSVSNLSQFSASQLSSWPSMSNFVGSKHQAKDILYDEEEQAIRMVLYNTLITMRVPTWLGPEYNLDQIIDAPAVKLKLDWVYGYRGRDCRSNIFYLPTGECIYFVASIVILYNPEAKSQRHYLGHTDSVKCLAVHPNKLIVASGQSAIANRRDKRPIVRVWNTVNLATLRVIGFNEDFDRSICCLAFSKHDAGATLAVVDESSEHTITLLDWQREKNWRVSEVNSGHEPVLAIDFHPIDKYSLVAVGKTSVNFWDIRGMTLAKKAGLFDKYDRPKYVLCMTFNDIGETITGDSNGNIIIWPRGTNKPRRIIRDVHPGGVFSVLAMKDGSYLTGGRDRRIVEWDENFELTGRQAGLPEHCGGVRYITYARASQVFIGTLRNAILMGSLDSSFNVIVQGHTEATTALAVHPNLPKYLTGGFDDQLQLIDAESHTLEWTKCMATPISAACFSPNGQTLILGSTSGNWFALDAITQEVLFTACDGTGTINCIKFAANGELFAMGSSDCHVYVYQTSPSGNTFCRLGTCVGHSAPVKEIDWSDDHSYLQSQSMNFELLFWKAHNCRPVDSEDIVHDLKWTTHNCTIGFNVIGIWSDSIDSALINYCDKSNNEKYVVSATDTGFLNVYKWPTYYNQCSSQKYYGNVDKFNFTKFLYDDSKLIAIGAKSCATTEWSIIEED